MTWKNIRLSNAPAKLWLDDERDPLETLSKVSWGQDGNHQDWLWVKNSQDAISHLSNNPVNEISLDHDLGDEKMVGTGYDVLKWIEERTATDPSYQPPEKIHIHSANTSAREKMEAAVKSIERFKNQRKFADLL